MAQQQQQGATLDEEKLCCCVCLDLLKGPDRQIAPCGHNYCSRCLEEYWDLDDQRRKASCPQCSQMPDHCYDGPEDVACDFCTRRKQKAVKTCLQCRVSYCDTHLQPHYQSPVFNNHKLVKATSKFPENDCAHHGRVMMFFCRTDQLCICYLCSVEEHKGHDTISAAAERTERQRNFDMSQQNIQQRIQEREKDVKVLHQEAKFIGHSADRAVEDSDAIFTNLTTSVKRRRSELRELTRDQQKHEASRVEEQMKCVEQEVSELRTRHAELEQLSHIEDPIHFLNTYTSLSGIGEPSHPVGGNVDPPRSFEDVTVAVSKVRDKLDVIFNEEEANISEAVNGVDVLLSASPEPQTRAEFLQTIRLEDTFKIKQMKRLFVVILFSVVVLTHPIRSSVLPPWTDREQSGVGVQCLVVGHNTNPGWLEFWGLTPSEPKSRAEFLQYSCPIRLDQNTAHVNLSLSEGNRKVTLKKTQYFDHPDRFTEWHQVLSRVGLSGRCYWEVEWSGNVDIALSYKDINRTGSFSLKGLPPNKRTESSTESGFGYSDKAWSLRCAPGSYVFNHRNSSTRIPGSSLSSSRVGVYLDHSAGTLSFYSVSDTMTLLHRVQTTFTQPLYPGIGLWFDDGASAELCDLR